MKKVGLILIALAMTSSAFAGTRILTCFGTQNETRIDIYQNPNSSMIAVVTTESSGGAYPQFKYLVGRVPPGMYSSATNFLGKHITLSIPARGPASLNVDDIGIHEFIKCSAK